MSELLFITRHPPTEGQHTLARRLGFESVRQVEASLTDRAPEEVAALGLSPGHAIALVAPLYVGLALLRGGYQVVEFVNDPIARRAGEFKCLGAYLHALSASEYVVNDEAAHEIG